MKGLVWNFNLQYTSSSINSDQLKQVDEPFIYILNVLKSAKTLFCDQIMNASFKHTVSLCFWTFWLLKWNESIVYTIRQNDRPSANQA